MQMILDKSYNKIDFINYLNDTLLPDFISEERGIALGDRSIFINMNYLGSSVLAEIAIIEAICREKDFGKRIAITQNAFRVLRQHGISNALIVFSFGKEQWRLSLLTSKLEYIEGKIVSRQSNPHRYSYLLGNNTKTHTPYKYLVEKGQITSLEELKESFSVEVVNKHFYEDVARNFTELAGGERNGKEFEGLLKIQSVKKPSIKYQEFAVRLIGRIMFCWFLKEKKSNAGIPLIEEKMLSTNAVCNNPNYYHSVLEPLFFELLNTRHKHRKEIFKEGYYKQIPYLNGGLFSPQADDHYRFSFDSNIEEHCKVSIPDEWFVSFFNVLENYSFTVDENTSYDVELSIDPEMLGRIFENLLAEITPETGESAKRITGSFYTPRNIVDYLVDTSLSHYLQSKTNISEQKLNAIISYNREDDTDNLLDENEQNEIIDALSSLTVIDPACGSGAFPIGILQKVVYVLQQADPKARLWVEKQYSSVTAPELKQEIRKKEELGLFDYIRKLGVIRESIFGVDIQTIATDIAKLRCFLSLIVDESVEDDEPNRGIQPLPNLDFKFITANTLVPIQGPMEQREDLPLFKDKSYIDELKRIRDEYFIADPDERLELKSEFKDAQRSMFQTTMSTFANTSVRNRYRSLSEWNPFVNESTSCFDSEWMLGVQYFNIVIGNPPYVQLQKSISPDCSEKVGDRYSKLGYDTFVKTGDLYCLFYEMGISLLMDNGCLSFITSNKWMRTEYGKQLRSYFARKINPKVLIDFSGTKVFETAQVDVNILHLEKSKNEESTKVCNINEPCKDNLAGYIEDNSSTMSFLDGSTWSILSNIDERIKAKIFAIGKPLTKWNITIKYGIKTGYNPAYVIDGNTKRQLCIENPASKEIIKPLLKGRDINKWEFAFKDLWLIVVHNGVNNQIPPIRIENYEAVKRYLIPYLDKLKKRSDQGVTPYHLRDCGYIENFAHPKIIFREMVQSPSFAFDYCGKYMCLDTARIIFGEHLEYLTGLFNSNLFFFAVKHFFGGGKLGRKGIRMKHTFFMNFSAYVPTDNEEKYIKNIVITVEKDRDKLINDFFYTKYGLSSEEIEHIEADIEK